MKIPTKENSSANTKASAGRDVRSERRASRRSSRRGRVFKKLYRFVSAHKKAFLIALIAAVIAVIALSILKKPSSKPETPPEDESSKVVVNENARELVDSFVYDYKRYDAKELIPYKGEIEYLSVQPVTAYPDKAYDGDQYHSAIDSRSLTANEFRAVLQNLYDNGYILISIDAAIARTADDNGAYTVSAGDLSLPAGKKPIVLIFEDMTYTDDMVQNGYVEKLIVGDSGGIWDVSVTESGSTRITQENDSITILERFVENHPDFSYNGAKGCIALTGDHGILGYNTQLTPENTGRAQAVSDLTDVVRLLKKSGWSFACHSYSHIALTSSNYASVTADLTRWVNEVGKIVGGTSVLIMPEIGSCEYFTGLRGTEVYTYLQSLGFDRFFIFGSERNVNILPDGSASFVSGLRLDGSTLRYSGDLFSKLFSAEKVLDLIGRRISPAQ